MAEQPSKVKVIFVEQTSELGGAQLNNYDFHKTFDRLRIDSLVICPNKGPLTERLDQLDVPVKIVPMLPILSTSLRFGSFYLLNPFAVFWDILSFIPLILKLRKVIKDENADVVATNGMLAHFYGGMAARIAGAPSVWLVGDIFNRNIGLGLGKKVLRFAAEKLPQKIVAVSKAVKQSMFPDLDQKCRVIYNGVDPEFYSPDVIKSAVLRKEYRIPEQAPVIGIFSRLIHWKGHREFIEAAALVHKKYPETYFLIVGAPLFESPEYEKELKKRVLELQLDHRIIFTGFRKDVAECLSSIDVACLPSILPEPFGRTIIEAMAMGKPVIATSLGGVPEIIIDQQTGLLVPPRDINALADAMSAIISNPNLKHVLGVAGRKRVKEMFTCQMFTDLHTELFCAIANAVKNKS